MTPGELLALADAATPGPWKIDPESPYYDEFSDIDLGQWWFSRPNIAALHETDARLIALAPDLARLCAEQHEMLGKAADTLADLAVSLRLLRHTTLATAVDIAETHTRAALAKMGELEVRCDLDH